MDILILQLWLCEFSCEISFAEGYLSLDNRNVVLYLLCLVFACCSYEVFIEVCKMLLQHCKFLLVVFSQ